MYVEGKRFAPRRYRFEIPEGVGSDDILFVMSGAQAALTPRDYVSTVTGQVVDIELYKDVPSAGGSISIFAFFTSPKVKKSTRGQPPRT